MLRWDEVTGAVGVFRHPSGYANGNARDAAGRLVTCEQGTRGVTRTEHDGSVTVLVDRFAGKRLNSPNDAVVARDGSVWFTDPSYGIDSDYQGHHAASEIGGRHVYRWDPRTSDCRQAAHDFEQPNGLAFSIDERLLYVSDSALNHLRAFAVGHSRHLPVRPLSKTANASSARASGKRWLTRVASGTRCSETKLMPSSRPALVNVHEP